MSGSSDDLHSKLTRFAPNSPHTLCKPQRQKQQQKKRDSAGDYYTSKNTVQIPPRPVSVRQANTSSLTAGCSL